MHLAVLVVLQNVAYVGHASNNNGLEEGQQVEKRTVRWVAGELANLRRGRP